MRITAALVCLLIASAATAQAPTGGYIGFKLGTADYNDSLFDDDATTLGIAAGYWFSEHFGLEGSINETGPFRLFVVGQPIELDADVLSVNALARIPFGSAGLSVIGGVGYHDFDFTVSGMGQSLGDSDRNTSLLIGGQVDFDRTQLRATYEDFDIDEASDSTAIFLSFSFYFR